VGGNSDYLRYQSNQSVPLTTLAQQNPEHIIQAFYSNGTASTISENNLANPVNRIDIMPSTISNGTMNSGFTFPFSNQNNVAVSGAKQQRNTPLILYQGQSSSIESLKAAKN
jgi:hypothetical protein